MRSLHEIIIHCTATPADWWSGKRTSEKVAEVKRWHVRDRGWSDIGYHFLIDRDGTVAKGRPLEKVGAHVQGRNTGTIGVSLFGGHGSAATDKFADHFTPAQEAALVKLLADLRKQYPTITRISGHNEFAAKACPGFNVPSWYAGKRQAAKPVVVVSPAPVSGVKPGFWSLLSALLAAFRGGKA